MIDFGELTKNTVHIGVGGGNWIEVPMLSVADYELAVKIQSDLMRLNEAHETTDSDRADAILNARKEFVAMASKVIPPELSGGLERLDFEKLVRLVIVLCTGNDDGEGDDAQKKMKFPSQVAREK